MKLGKNVFIFFSIIIKLKCLNLSYTMKKISCNNSFCPYMLDFDFFFNDSHLPVFFDTTSFLHIKNESNIICNDTEYITIKNELIKGDVLKNNYFNKNLTYININSKHIISSSVGIGMNDKNINLSNNYNNTYLEFLKLNNVEKYIYFIQEDSNKAMMLFGEKSKDFNENNQPTCGCDKMKNFNNTNHIYWCCGISSIKVGGETIQYSLSKAKKLYGVFAISEEYIIAPKISGEEVLNYYLKKINDNYGEQTCEKKENSTKISYLDCSYFNFLTLPNLYIKLNGEFVVMALSCDLFKEVGEKDNKKQLLFKLIVNNNDNDSDLNWYIGEPIIKNYNFFLDYNDQKNIKISIMPNSLNGYLLIFIAVLGGFLFLIIFLGILYYLSKKEKIELEMEKYKDIINKDNIENSDEFNNRKKGRTSKGMEDIFKGFSSPTNLITDKLDDKEDNKNNKDNKNIKNNKKDNNNNNTYNEIKKGNKYKIEKIESCLSKANKHRNNDINQDTRISPQNIEFSLNEYGMEVNDDDNDDDFFVKEKK